MFLKEETLGKPTDCFILCGFLWFSFRVSSFLATYIFVFLVKFGKANELFRTCWQNRVTEEVAAEWGQVKHSETMQHLNSLCKQL